LQVESIDEIVLATTTNKDDDILEAIAGKTGVKCFRGSELDVMRRIVGAGEFSEADVIVETTGDCPIIDPIIVEQTIRMFKEHDVPYVSNNHVRSYPDGMDVQVFTLDALKYSMSMTDDPLDHEHVTLHIRSNPKKFPRVHLVAPPDLHWPELGLTLDEEADYRLIKYIIESLSPENTFFSCAMVITFLRENPDLIRINSHVSRKGDT
jgi:spore coat polysaccharide biosynthesis protein SpsF